ncbi:MAG: hypothetical protein CL482_14065 [Acidobacteria bacterium]|jgi:hypothetical protein|nr:hypothetical protein [Acidobacteriota bacterium]MEE2964550.1 hypothetical protein [Acidobacteriota bacterium]
MRDQWYGDDRDVLKWSTLVHLARRESVTGILHVAMYRPSQPIAPLATAFGAVAPPDEVLRHFRDVDDIQRLATATGLEVDVFKSPFTDRVAYFGEVCGLVRARSGRVIVFLDPDIGIEAEQGGPEHVTSADIARVFEALRPGGLLVCYQHARRQKGWRGRARRAFANAPGMPSFDVEVVESELVRDVLMFSVKKV